MSLEEVGEVYYSRFNVINWTIPSFTLLSQKKMSRIWSPSFVHHDGERNRPFILGKESFIDLNFRCQDGKETPVKCVRFGLADISNSVICSSDGEWEPSVFSGGHYKVRKFVSENSLNSNWNSLREKPRFRLFCEVVNMKHRRVMLVNASNQIDNSCAAESLGSLPVPYPRSYAPTTASVDKEGDGFISRSCSKKADESKSQDLKTTRCFDPSFAPYPRSCTPTAASVDKEGDGIISRSCSKKADESKSQDLKNLEKLSQNFKELYIKKIDTDLTINVKDREFKAHKAVLRVRSSVFEAMFSHGLSESQSGVIPIEDCEPDVFEEFLFFIYGGRINLSCDNACEVYYLADKYDMPELKEECINFLKKSLSSEIICDVICLSTKYNERELLDLSTNFFARNMEEILVTVKWQLFMKENPTEANELTIKALKIGFTKRKF